MSDLIVLGFKDQFQADKVLAEINELEHEHLVDLEDAAVVIRGKNGKVKIRQTHDITGASTATGFWWGGLIGLLAGWIVLNPLLGWVAGAGVGSLFGWIEGKTIDLGINDDFMKQLGETLTPESSAIFVLVRSATVDRVLEDLRKYGGKLLHTSLSKEDEDKLREALSGAVEAQ